MSTALSISPTEGVRQTTLDAHTQAIEQTITVMHTHMHEPLSLADLASVAYLSPFHFNRVFRRLIGIPPGEFLAALRLYTARRLLLETSLSVTDICFKVGYNSHSSFTTRFTQLVGLSPRILRQRARCFELPVEQPPAPPAAQLMSTNTLQGWISAPPSFQGVAGVIGVIYIGLFTSPIPQGSPASCTRLYSPGHYQLEHVPDGVYYLFSAAFLRAANPQAYLAPPESIMVSTGSGPLIMRDGHLYGSLDLTLRPPHLTDPPLVIGLPFV